MRLLNMVKGQKTLVVKQGSPKVVRQHILDIPKVIGTIPVDYQWLRGTKVLFGTGGKGLVQKDCGILRQG